MLHICSHAVTAEDHSNFAVITELPIREKNMNTHERPIPFTDGI